MSQTLAVGRRQDHRLGTGPALLPDPIDGGEQRLRLQHHPRSTAKRHIVHHAMPVGGEIPQVVDAHVDQPATDRPSDHSLRQWPFHHSRKDGDDIDLHSCVNGGAPPCPFPTRFNSSSPGGGSTTITCDAGSTVTQIPATSGIRISPAPPAITSWLRSIGPSTAMTLPTASPPRVRTSQPTRS